MSEITIFLDKLIEEIFVNELTYSLVAVFILLVLNLNFKNDKKLN